MSNQFSDYNIPFDGYTAFDALSLKSLIIKRLNNSNVFTDQNYEGSNISAVIDIIAYAYHTLMFYLNRTSSESTFTTAELYENINKIVKVIGYSPIGYQTAILPFQATGTAALPIGTYTIPRYTYFTLDGVSYSFTQDVTFTKSLQESQILTTLQEDNLLYQGLYTEYPTYIANGEPFEIITMAVVDLNGTNIIIDHFNIDIYVKDNSAETPVWERWGQTPSLFLERSNAKVYEKRLNENQRYEIKFGNNIAGKKLNPGDEVAIYYLKSNGQRGEIGTNILNGNRAFLYNTSRFNQIQTDTTPPNLALINPSLITEIQFKNQDPSTKFVDIESVSQIKNNATNTFKAQYRLITALDFENYVFKNYSNLIASTKVVNNWDYISGHQKYYFDLGVDNPNLESRVLFNQVKFADSSNSNNVYVYAVPKLEKISSVSTRTNYLNSAQKQAILNDLQQTKLTTAEIIINDPVYTAIDLGVQIPGVPPTPDIADTTVLEITRNVTAKRNPEAVRELVYGIFRDYFSTTKNNLGLYISLTELSNQILSIEGVDDIVTKRLYRGTTYTAPGVSLLAFNPVYPFNDIDVITQDTPLPYFKFPYLNNATNFINKIQVFTPSIQLLNREF
jgi:hypothetical protein